MSSVEQLEKEFLEDRMDANKLKRQQYEEMRKREAILAKREEGKKWVPWLKHREDEQNFGPQSLNLNMQRLKTIKNKKDPYSGKNSKGSHGRLPRKQRSSDS